MAGSGRDHSIDKDYMDGTKNMPYTAVHRIVWSQDQLPLSDGCLEADISPSLAQSSQYDDLDHHDLRQYDHRDNRVRRD